MDKETFLMCLEYFDLANCTDLNSLSLQELFDHRHEVLTLQNKIEKRLNELGL